MQDRPPLKPDNRRATGIAVASIAALLLAVGLATSGALPSHEPERPRGHATVAKDRTGLAGGMNGAKRMDASAAPVRR